MSVNTVDPRLNPYTRYKTMRESQPVYYNEMVRMWEVFCYNDVQRVLSEHATFSSEFTRW